MKILRSIYEIIRCYFVSLASFVLLNGTINYVSNYDPLYAIGVSFVFGGIYHILINVLFIFIISRFKRFKWVINVAPVFFETISMAYLGTLYGDIAYHYFPKYRWNVWMTIVFIYIMQTLLYIVYIYIKKFRIKQLSFLCLRATWYRTLWRCKVHGWNIRQCHKRHKSKESKGKNIQDCG